MQLPSEHHVEFREAEHKRVTLVDEHDVNGIAESIERIVVSSRPPNRAPRTTTRVSSNLHGGTARRADVDVLGSGTSNHESACARPRGLALRPRPPAGPVAHDRPRGAVSQPHKRASRTTSRGISTEERSDLVIRGSRGFADFPNERCQIRNAIGESTNNNDTKRENVRLANATPDPDFK